MITQHIYQSCLQNDRHAQRQLYDLLAPKLYNACKRYLSNESDIHDVLTETFLKIFSKLSQLNELNAIDGWAKKIAVRQCLLLLKKTESFAELHDDLAESNALVTAPNDMSDKDLLQLLNFLPKSCKAVFNLFAIEGYSHREIAAMLQIAEGTSKSQLNYAKSKLSALINQYYFKTN